MGLLANGIKQENAKFIKLSEAIVIIANITKDNEDDVIRFFNCTSTAIYEEWLAKIELFQKNNHGGYYPNGDFLTVLGCYDDAISYDKLYEDKFFRDTYVKKAEFFSKDLVNLLGVNFAIKDIKESRIKQKNRSEGIGNPIDKSKEYEHEKYISVNKFVNDLSKTGSFGAGHPLKDTVKYIVENYSSDFHLYSFKNKVYSLVSEKDKYENASEILWSFYDVLDNNQTGTVKSDREPFTDFYFLYSEVGYLIGSDPKTVEEENLVYAEEEPYFNETKLLDNSSAAKKLGENQRLLITYSLFTPEDLTCLLIDENPACISHNDNYLRHHHMVTNAVDAKFLNLNDEGKILAEQVKIWLANHGFVYKGFNDGTPTYADQLAEMREEAIEANIKVLNLTAKLEDTELDSIIHNHTAHKFLLSDAQATIDQLSKENAELRANKNIEASRPKYDDEVGDYKIESLIAENEQLDAKFNDAQVEINRLKDQLKKINDHRMDVSAIDQVLEFDWYNLDRAIYPPELHLGLALWQQMYQSNKIQNTYHNSHNSRFEVAAKRLGLNPHSSLGKRLNTVTNPVRSKMGQHALAKQLWDIKILNIPVVLIKKPK